MSYPALPHDHGGDIEHICEHMPNTEDFQTVADIFNKNDYKDAGVMKTVVSIRTYNKRLGFSQKWITDFVYQVVMLAKKEPRPNTEDDK